MHEGEFQLSLQPSRNESEGLPFAMDWRVSQDVPFWSVEVLDSDPVQMSLSAACSRMMQSGGYHYPDDSASVLEGQSVCSVMQNHLWKLDRLLQGICASVLKPCLEMEFLAQCFLSSLCALLLDCPICYTAGLQ